MQQTEQLHELGVGEKKRVEAVVETLAMLNGQGESLAEVAHDARNMVTALDLYCDLLQEPGVLAAQFSHYGFELKVVAAASRRLVDKLVILEIPDAPARNSTLTIEEVVRTHRNQAQHWQSVPTLPIANFAEELLINRNLLAALAGPAIALTVDVQGGALPVRLTSEDLTRVLVNLVKNATEAMSAVGRVHISLRESPGEPANVPWLTLNVEDNGPGILDSVLENIFEPGQTAHVHRSQRFTHGTWPTTHRGLGLSICRSIVQAAGGLIRAANRDPVGACFQIALPVTSS